MHDGLSLELRALVFDAARPVAPGESIKGQMRRAHANLGYPPWWRLRSAWYGEAGRWTARIVEDFRQRHRALEAKRKRQDALRIDEAQDKAAVYLARLDRLRQALVVADADFFGPDIDAIGLATDRLRRIARVPDDE
jgi:hypothetical protein